jgi:CspA family cold shock protein
MESGTIKWFDNKKGFGFITREGGGQDVFVHFSCIGGEGFKTLEEGDRVEYEASESEKGLKASKVVKLSSATVHDVKAAGSPRPGQSPA